MADTESRLRALEEKVQQTAVGRKVDSRFEEQDKKIETLERIVRELHQRLQKLGG